MFDYLFGIKKNWNGEIVGNNGVRFSLLSEDGSGGFPGRVQVGVTYTLDANQNALHIEYVARTTKPTPIDLTNHVYFNLEGRDARKKIYDHLFKINANQVLRTNGENWMPTGDVDSVDNVSRYDFREFVRLSTRINNSSSSVSSSKSGFNSYFIVDQQSGIKYAAS